MFLHFNCPKHGLMYFDHMSGIYVCPKCEQEKQQTVEQGGRTIEEKDPNGLDPHAPGAKLDAGKIPVRRGLLEYFPRACLAVARISMKGAQKYAWKGWEHVEDGINRYGDAEVRHICNAAIEGEIDPAIDDYHAAEEAWNAMARLELILREKEKHE